MRHSRVIVIALVFLVTGWGLWVFLWGLWPNDDVTAAKPFAKLSAAASRARWPKPDKTPAGDIFTFEHNGQTVTVDLVKVRRSHELLIRQPPASPDPSAVGAPDPDFDCLSWPGRKFQGVETVKTRKCWVIDFTKPQHSGPHCLVRLYVDQDLGALMRMQAYDWSGKLVLGYTVTAGKKVDGELTVKTAEALHYEPGTKRVVEEVEYRVP